jgi:hypothetical protein
LEAFLDKYYAIINFAIVFLPAIIGLLLYKKYKNSLVKYFIWFCVYVGFVEIIGAYPKFINKFESLNYLNELLKDSLFVNSNWWYLIFWNFAGALFYAFYFYNLINNGRLKIIIKYLSFLFVCIFIIYFIKNIKILPFNSNSFLTISSAILIVATVLMYFVDVLKSDKLLSVFRTMSFYIGAIILLWHLITNPLRFYDMYFNRSDLDFAIMNAIIFLGCNTIMYVTFSIALIWCKPQNN